MRDPEKDAALIERMRPVQVRIRVDLATTREVYADSIRYILRDPITSQSLAFNPREYEILIALDAKEPLGDNFAALVKQGTMSDDEEPEFYNFVVELHRAGVITLPVPDSKALYGRYLQKRQAGLKKRITGFLFLQIPLLCPDPFLDRTIKYVRFLYTRWFFIFWLFLMGGVAHIAFTRWDALVETLPGMMHADSLLLMWAGLIGLKVLHEFGHAYACKHLGGDVPEMGVFLIVLSPSAYVDASAAWTFPRLRDRVIVSLGGMYIESLIGAAALFYWAFSPPSPIRGFAYQLFLLSTVVTIGFNANPLMRYDGYFILSDLLKIPNLRSRSTEQVKILSDRLLLGLRHTTQRLSARLKLILVTYGISAAIYRAGLILGICTLIATKLYWLGMGLAAFYVGSTLFGMVTKGARHLLWSPVTQEVRGRAVTLAALIGLGIPAILAFVQVRENIVSWGTLGMEEEVPVRLQARGVIDELRIRPGEVVKSGQPLATLHNLEVLEELRDAKAEAEVSRIEHHLATFEDRSEARALAKQLAHLRERTRTAEEKVAALSLVAPTDGRILQLPPLEEESAFHKEGTLLCTIGSGRWTVRLLLDAEAISEAGPRPGTKVNCRLVNDPERDLVGTVVRIAPRGDRLIDEAALTQLGGGDIVVQPDNRQASQAYFEVIVALDSPPPGQWSGQRAAVRFPAPRKPVFSHLKRWFARFSERLRAG